MPGLAPNIDNYTVPGGIKLFFNDGAGQRDLGNIASLDMEPSSDELEHKSNRSGKRRTDKVLALEDKLLFKFKLDEPVIENLKYLFKGGSIESQGEGTGTVTDQKVTLSETAFVSVGAYYGISSVSVRQFLDYVFLYDGTSAYTDNSAEADSLAGTAFDLMADSSDVLYLGKLTPFNQVYFDLAVNGSYGTLTWEYWDGSTWESLTVAGAGAALAADGKVTFTQPADWAPTFVNSVQGYFIRVSAASVTTVATVNSIRQAGVLHTDFTVDAGSAAAGGRRDGRVARISGGMFADGEEVKVSFTHTTWTAIKMGLFTGSMVEGSARLEIHPSSGRGIQHDYIFPKAVIRPSGAVPFDDSKWLEVSFELQVLDDSENHPDYPMGYVLSNETS